MAVIVVNAESTSNPRALRYASVGEFIRRNRNALARGQIAAVRRLKPGDAPLTITDEMGGRWSVAKAEARAVDKVKNIGGVVFVAVHKDRPRPHWRYAVAGREGMQGYFTRPAMWADLERGAKLRGAEQWLKDWARFAADAGRA